MCVQCIGKVVMVVLSHSIKATCIPTLQLSMTHWAKGWTTPIGKVKGRTPTVLTR